MSAVSGESGHIFADNSEFVVYTTDGHPDFQNPKRFVKIETVTFADRPAYMITADNVTPIVAGKHYLTIMNNLQVSQKRIRVQSIECYPKTLGTNNVVIQACVLYNGTTPTLPNGTTLSVLLFNKNNIPNPDPVANPTNHVVAKTGTTNVTFDATRAFGGKSFSLAAGSSQLLFNASAKASAIQLYPNDILTVFGTSSATAGTITTHLIFTLD